MSALSHHPPSVYRERILSKIPWLILGAFAFVFWYSTHSEHPQELRGTWIGEYGDTTAWTEADTIWLGPGNTATRRGWAVWHGKHERAGDTGLPDSLDLRGQYTWGVRRSLLGPTKLCLRYRQEDPHTPPFGCFQFTRNGEDLIFGKVHFRRMHPAFDN